MGTDIQKMFSKTSYYYERIKAKYNNKEKIFLIVFDKIDYFEEEKKVILKGWGASTLDFSPLEYTVLNENYSVKRILRVDVNQLYELAEDVELGFEITIKDSEIKKVYRILLETNNGIQFPLILNSKKIGRLKLKDILYQTKKDIQNEGIGEALEKLNYKIKTKEWNDFSYWIYKNEQYNLEEVKKEMSSFIFTPRISLVVPVYNVDESWLRAFIDSVINQVYQNWELCIADDASPSPHVKKVLEEYRLKDSRIQVLYREENGHISEATNSAISLVTGEYVGFMDNDDELSPFALYEYVKVINEDEEYDFIYCDEDKIDTRGRRFDPFFKSSWNRELLYNHNYITHFVVVKKELLDQVGLLKSEYNGSQDYDFILRATEKAKKIYHIPKLLYHWRTIEGSVAFNPKAKMYCYEAGKNSLEDSLNRFGIKGKVELGKYYGTYKTRFFYEDKPKLSIITIFDKIEEINAFIDRFDKSVVYEDIEFIFGIKEAVVLQDKIDDRIKYVFSKENNCVLKNKCSEIAEGKYLLFLDKKLEFTEKWLDELLNLGRNKGIGATGAKIVDSNNQIVNVGMYFNEENKVIYSHKKCFDNGDYKGYFYRIVAPQYVYAVSDDCLLVEKSIFHEVGGYTENLSFPLSAIDLCLKIRKHGYKVLFNPFCKVIQPQKSKNKVKEEEFLLFKQNWNENDLKDPYTNVNLVKRELR